MTDNASTATPPSASATATGAASGSAAPADTDTAADTATAAATAAAAGADTVDVQAIAARASAAARPFAQTAPRERARALVAVADALAAASDELIETAMDETGLARPRLTGELKRTVVQLKLFAETIVDGAYLDARIDPADPDFVLGPRPDLRRTLVPVGPVLNFAGSNFPFAFSVAGGDTAAALAAGCPIIVKGHPGHPELSKRTAAIVTAALASAGMPDGVFQLALGQEAGVTLLKDERIRAGSFTGSLRAGRMLADIAAARPRPIPFFGELGSVNPVFVFPSATADAAAIGAGFAASISGSAGQLCTKPGFLFVPADAATELTASIAAAVADVPEHRMLNPQIASGFSSRQHTVLAVEGVSTVVDGALRTDGEQQAWVTPTVASTTVAALAAAGSAVLDEAFGPLSVVVAYDDVSELTALAAELFPGNLTATVFVGEGDASPVVEEFVATLSETSGRVLFGGWPTGVAVTPAMQHGGPYPATTSDSGTSVGSAAITRFLRAVTYQDAPEALLPPQLRDDNPWNVPQRIAPAGDSAAWGQLR
ncbi:aldehyde dehydrogenase (NADP(+)) [Subtercola sp. Z020]|uniref:aldehyde dehydrogenase family protein n=1 Tax=Subtercola sp. Z020 TaxID=2080582 RepID=UPI000CE74270|nr:aldehyde dehydrogenase family protein [Subtercola sp. Z020]PPF78312.1 aldehyde dehydrogenase (NADP(+)) [Subtercola sp. Z020]